MCNLALHIADKQLQIV